MDLRQYDLTGTRVAEGKRLLNYQPFRLSDSVHTGVGYSWLHASDLDHLNRPQLVFDKAADDEDTWQKSFVAYRLLARTYDAFLDTAISECPGGSYLDLCCNSGYLPVAASKRGMNPSIGVDVGDFSAQIEFLNKATGSRASFASGEYRPREHRFILPFTRRFDVVSNMAFMCHVPDPLHLLKSISELSDHAVLLWSGFPREDAMVIRYPAAPNQFSAEAFPWGFDAGTAISDSLLVLSMRYLGFSRHREIVPADGWPPEWDNPFMRPYQPLRAFLFMKS
jgi:SAM-dependent methyltransferase